MHWPSSLAGAAFIPGVIFEEGNSGLPSIHAFKSCWRFTSLWSLHSFVNLCACELSSMYCVWIPTACIVLLHTGCSPWRPKGETEKNVIRSGEVFSQQAQHACIRQQHSRPSRSTWSLGVQVRPFCWRLTARPISIPRGCRQFACRDSGWITRQRIPELH